MIKLAIKYGLWMFLAYTAFFYGCIMLVGDPFSGKTQCLHVLAEMSNRMNEIEHEQAGNLVEKVKYKTVNPKAITMGQLSVNSIPFLTNGPMETSPRSSDSSRRHLLAIESGFFLTVPLIRCGLSL